jgi:sulfur carrier protein
MEIILNNKSERFEQSHLSIEELIHLKNYTFKMLVTRLNDKLVKKEDRTATQIEDGDKVDILHLMSGG